MTPLSFVLLLSGLVAMTVAYPGPSDKESLLEALLQTISENEQLQLQGDEDSAPKEVYQDGINLEYLMKMFRKELLAEKQDYAEDVDTEESLLDSLIQNKEFQEILEVEAEEFGQTCEFT